MLWRSEKKHEAKDISSQRWGEQDRRGQRCSSISIHQSKEVVDAASMPNVCQQNVSGCCFVAFPTRVQQSNRIHVFSQILRLFAPQLGAPLLDCSPPSKAKGTLQRPRQVVQPKMRCVWQTFGKSHFGTRFMRQKHLHISALGQRICHKIGQVATSLPLVRCAMRTPGVSQAWLQQTLAWTCDMKQYPHFPYPQTLSNLGA